MHIEKVWEQIKISAKRMAEESPILAKLAESVVLNSPDFKTALGRVLSRYNNDTTVTAGQLFDLFESVYSKAPDIIEAAAYDILAVLDRDPAATDIAYPFFHFKGFHALQTYRISNFLWKQGQKDTAVFLQNRSSMLYSVDIHPAAKIGKGILLDHAHSVVIGETAVIEDNVSMLHETTLGGNGKDRGDRHPKVRQGVVIGAGAKILGNVTIGKNSSIASGSVVLENVEENTTVAGVPAKLVGKAKHAMPSMEMDHTLPL
ncbi:MAG: serine O-acetyltransferase [Alphaproteobacteria bacterium]|nr:serine O-acetyltransferase [Alphaproteobacteria bacterium]MCL2505129.1 serine O-acetyltransferase [Alphaproteobacteria bacterium]